MDKIKSKKDLARIEDKITIANEALNDFYIYMCQPEKEGFYWVKTEHGKALTPRGKFAQAIFHNAAVSINRQQRRVDSYREKFEREEEEGKNTKLSELFEED